MIVYEIKEYFIKDDETLQTKMEDFNKLGFELLSTEKEDGIQKLILRRSKELKNYQALVKITEEIDELEKLISLYEDLGSKRVGLKEIPNIPRRMIKTFSLLAFLAFSSLAVYNLIKENQLMMIVFFISGIIALTIFLVLLIKKDQKKTLYQTTINKIKKEIKLYFDKADKLEKR